ncbi:hypothetical protein P5673_015950 [Acropora cervicornis]|uniref:UspA domain-containing protein n=3 Tax=Acropora TaxID=6127 RepID=A0AAD9QHL5_ACRCE|nr:hypothetical protein P5673_015950 [Acropora cervicornis]
MSSTNVVLIPLDGSKNSERAVNSGLVHATHFQTAVLNCWYMEHFHLKGDRVVFIHAFDPVPMQSAKHTGVDFKNSYDEWCILMQKAQDSARCLLKEYDDRFAGLKDKLSYKMIHDTGKPGEVIIDYSKKENATCIVMGSRGLGKIRRTLIGSVSDYVVRHSLIPVVVIPPFSS